jgi:hypothetical protein
MTISHLSSTSDLSVGHHRLIFTDSWILQAEMCFNSPADREDPDDPATFAAGKHLWTLDHVISALGGRGSYVPMPHAPAGVCGLGLGLGVWGLESAVWGPGFGVWSLGFGVWGLESAICGLGEPRLGFPTWIPGFLIPPRGTDVCAAGPDSGHPRDG